MRTAIDVGHGWHNRRTGVFDPGAVYKRFKEHAEAWWLAKRVAKRLRKYGHKVKVYKSGNYLKRHRRAVKWGAELFVSIHLNAATGSATGTETFIHPQSGKTSRELADNIQDRLVKALDLEDRGVKEYGYAVLSGKLPAALVEVCFITSKVDMARLRSRRKQAYKAIADGIHKTAGPVKYRVLKKTLKLRPSPKSAKAVKVLKRGMKVKRTGDIKDGRMPVSRLGLKGYIVIKHNGQATIKEV
jgi:N-acetylmuramoyl-L-alanine amidase